MKSYRWAALAVCVLIAATSASAQYRIIRRYPPGVTPPGMTPYATRTPRAVAPEERAPGAERSAPSERSAISVAPAASSRATVITKPTSIQAPGSYVLGSDIVAPDDLSTGAIVISAPGVTLDLAGFSIRGRNASSGDASGVAIFAERVAVRNGSISDFNRENQCGLVVGAGVRDFAIDDLRIGDCESGILLNPEDNAADAPQSGHISRCQISDAAVGILSFPSIGVTISDCQISGASARHQAEGEGSGALLKGSSFAVERCNFSGNTHGLRMEADSSRIVDTTCAGNRNVGLYVGGKGCFVQSCVVSGNGIFGVDVNAAGCTLQDSVFNDNAGNGITLDAGQGQNSSSTIVRRCSIISNAGDGISDKGSGSAVIEGCAIANNTQTGCRLQKSDVYRNCVFTGQGPKDGVDGGGNLPPGTTATNP